MPEYLKKVIVINPKIHSGMPIIVGTRVTVAEIIDYIQEDKTVTDVIDTLKKAGVLVTRDQVLGALEYAKFSTLNEAQKKQSSK